MYTVLQPGEVLYIPAYWWHYIESPYEETISVNFWARCGPTRNPEIPLKNVMQRMALRRNIEKLAGTYLACSSAVMLCVLSPCLRSGSGAGDVLIHASGWQCACSMVYALVLCV
jgi:hypothetical protein